MTTYRIEAMSIDIIPVLKQVVLAGHKLRGISSINKEIRAAGVAKLRVELNAECPDELRLQLLQRANVVELELRDDLRSTPIFIPDSVQKLELCSSFQGTIINMPVGLKSAELSFKDIPRTCGTIYEPDQLISQLPSGLNKLDITNISTTCPNKCCCTDYPSGLKNLILSECDTIEAPLPLGLKELMLDNAPETAVYPILQFGLEELTIYTNGSIDYTVYPDSLQELFLQGPIVQHQLLPSNLVSFCIESENSFTIGTLPSSLQELDLTKAKAFNEPLGPLPACLRVLGLGQNFNQPLPLLPPELKILHLGYNFSSILGPLPQLQLLQFNGEYGRLRIPSLPLTLLQLQLPIGYSDFIAIPHGLKFLTIQPEDVYDSEEDDEVCLRVWPGYLMSNNSLSIKFLR